MDEIKNELKAYQNLPSNNEALQDVFADTALLNELHKMGLTDEIITREIPLVSSYQDDRAYCAHCPGLDQCEKEPNPQASMKLVLLHGLLQREYSPCSLYMEKDRLLKGYLYRDFPEEWLSVLLKSLPKSKRILTVVKAFVSAEKNPDQSWVYLVGEMGSGRSYLLAAYANLQVSQGLKVAYLNANKRFDELKGLAISSRPLFEKRMGELESLDLLVIDDFGSEYKSDYVRDQIVLPLLNERAKKNLPTFFASDYSLEEIQNLYSTDKTSAIYAKGLVNLIRSHILSPVTVEKGFETYLGKK
jgi:primosomal protein DnaI